MLPLAFGAHAAVRRPSDWHTATALVTRIIGSLTTFFFLMDAYLLFGAMR